MRNQGVELNPVAASAERQGRRLRALRESLGMSRTEIAGTVGIEQTYWSRFELGRRPLTLDIAARICGRYDITLDWLVMGRWDMLKMERAATLAPFVDEEDRG